MTPLSDTTASPPGSKAERSESYVAAARAAIFWERLWRASWPATGVIGFFVAAGLFDIFTDPPAWIHLLALFLTCLLAGTLLHINFRAFRFPRWEEGARRVERDSALSHRPITEGHDKLAAGHGDPRTEELWRVHLRRLLAGATQLRVCWPSPRLQSRDPYALRFGVLVLLIAGLAVARTESLKRIAAALTPDAGIHTSIASLDAWINPPAYTGEAPIYLQAPAAGDDGVSVPVGSELVMRVHAARGIPHLTFQPQNAAAQFKGQDGEFGANVRLTGDSSLRAVADGKLLARLRIRTITDNPPVIAFARPPSKTERGALKIDFTAADDYGVVSARAIIRPVAKNSKAVLSIDLPLSAASAKTLSQTVYRDLTGEPLAGVDVEIVLEAKDGAGQTGVSKPVRMHLPARVFTNPLSRALIEQRQTLALGAPHAKESAELALDAVTIAPERFFTDQSSAYLAIRSAYWGLKTARRNEDVERVEQILWNTAVALEQGGLLAAADELRRLQQMISQALEQGAPQDVIDALLDRYRQALQRYLQALAQNAPQPNNAPSQNAKTISPQDLDALLKAIQQMAQTGSRGAAAEALAMLQNLLENLKVTGSGSGSGGSSIDKALSDAIQGLGDLIGRQRELLDKSYRQGQGAGDPKDGGGKGLAESQGRLKGDVEKILKGLGSKAPHALGDAERHMGSAQDRLGANDFDNAGQAEKDALEALRESADSLARALLQQGGQNGAAGEANQQDPLGRGEGSSGFGSGNGVKIPDRDTLARARSILQELRRRAAERGRPKEELDYYDRLLKEF
jgi:uncharacterized protein (TIGR02302 family)